LSAALLPLVLFSVVWTSFALWRCQSDGLTRSKCCCPSKTVLASGAGSLDQSEPTRTATISRPRCCDFEQVDVDKAPAEITRNNVVQVAGAMAAAWAAFPLPALAPLAVAAPRHPHAIQLEGDGPPTGRALLLQKQSLLI
jgi:hypothetical protein